MSTKKSLHAWKKEESTGSVAAVSGPQGLALPKRRNPRGGRPLCLSHSSRGHCRNDHSEKRAVFTSGLRGGHWRERVVARRGNDVSFFRDKRWGYVGGGRGGIGDIRFKSGV